MASEGETQAVLEALQAFRRTPATFDLGKREPRALFDNLREVLSLAAGPQSRSASVTARAFLAKALLRAGATHYELLGVDPAAPLASLKERYRLLMRIAHPDFAADGTPWPADTAARLNLAYETLSSPERRAKYDADQKAAKQAPPPIRPQRREPVRPAAPKARWVRPRNDLKYLAGICGLIGLVAAGAWLVSGTEEHGMVQLPAPVTLPAAAATAPANESWSVTASASLPLEAAVMEFAKREPAPPKLQQLAARTPEADEPKTIPAPPRETPRDSAPAASAAPAAATPPTIAPASLPAAPALTPLAQIMAEAARPPVVNDTPELTLEEVQPLVTALVQAMESGQPGRIEALVQDRGPSFTHFMKEYDRITAGARSRKIVRMQFDPAASAKGKFVLTGRVWLQSSYLLTQDVYMLAVQTEFVRAGSTVRLARIGYL